MARRRRKAMLGLSPSEHRSVGVDAAHDAVRHSHQAFKATNRGDCVAAYNSLALAESNKNRARVELFSYGNHPRGDDAWTRAFRDATSAVRNSAKIFKRKCLR